MNLFKFWLGKKSKINDIAKKKGNLIVTDDTGELYADTDGNTRKPIGYSRDDIDFKLSGYATGESIETHNHDGSNSKKIDFGNIEDAPVMKLDFARDGNATNQAFPLFHVPTSVNGVGLHLVFDLYVSRSTNVDVSEFALLGTAYFKFISSGTVLTQDTWFHVQQKSNSLRSIGYKVENNILYLYLLDKNGYTTGSVLIKQAMTKKENIMSYVVSDTGEFPSPTITDTTGIEVLAERTNTIDNLTSTSVTEALSANQGRVLDEKISAIQPTKTIDLKSLDKTIAYPVRFDKHTDIFISRGAHRDVSSAMSLSLSIQCRSTSWGGNSPFYRVMKNAQPFGIMEPNVKKIKGAGTSNFICVWLQGGYSYTVYYNSTHDTDSTPIIITEPITESNGTTVIEPEPMDSVLPNGIYEGISNVNITKDSIPHGKVTDSLTSTSTADALSANQGRVLNEKIQELVEKVELLESKMS